MKSNYVDRARKFVKSFMPFLIKYGDNMCMAVHEYNMIYNRHVKYSHGAARRCLCLSDYAVKWDYNKTNVVKYGGCENELINYNFARDYGYEYLFAEITPIEVMGRIFYVMPRVKKLAIDLNEYDPDSRLSVEEYEFIYETMGLRDMHDENWGVVKGSVKIIDYAMRVGNRE